MRQDLKEKRLQRRRRRVRKRVFGTAARPRLSVCRSLRHIHAQVIDDDAGMTLAAASSLDASVKGAGLATGNCDAAKQVGQLVAQRALEKGIETVVFDRNGRLYHGRLASLAEGAREAGLKF